jgi:hypothetical protein
VEITRDGTVTVTNWVLCCAVCTGDRSQSASVKSFGGGEKNKIPSRMPSHGSAEDNAALPGSLTAAAVPFDSEYFAFRTGSLKAIEASLSCGTWTFMCNTERKLTHVNRVRCVFILLTESLKLKFCLWLVFTLFCDS